MMLTYVAMHLNSYFWHLNFSRHCNGLVLVIQKSVIVMNINVDCAIAFDEHAKDICSGCIELQRSLKMCYVPITGLVAK